MKIKRPEMVRMGVAFIAACGLVGASQLSIAQNLPVPGKHHFSLTGIPKARQGDNQGADIELTAAQTEGRYSFLDEIWQPGMTVPAHYHKEHAEIFYVVSGQVEWTVGGETQLMGAGDLVYIPPNTVHSVKVVGDKDVHTLMLYDPGGFEKNMEREAQYTEEQRRDPQIQAELRRLNDFNMVQ